ncbi:MAG TPA: DUF1573 domain-containing protein [Flavilitoribacter sp.]|nr:DUF1573 domain-containing protein [Lewinella sp.]MCB9278696.1 DUF1573 domain-containing protein [Lewinellaceae bacterium]HMQ59655.1 DUF1573 domain-containing protein [Flavilitoribacter sp.]HMQ87801.1 DUF1573 domain-containing protein [Flavilitoribacter sp.]
MRKLILSFIAVLAVAALVVSCQSSSKDVRDEARTSVETGVQPANPSPNVTPNQAAPTAPTGPTTVMAFEETTFEFGTVQEGEKVTHTYKFKNTGKEPLVISNAQGSCGCTVPQWSKEPVAPGASGSVTVEFNSKNKNGKRNQKVTLTANTDPPQTFLYLTGEVVGGESAQPQIQVNN